MQTGIVGSKGKKMQVYVCAHTYIHVQTQLKMYICVYLCIFMYIHVYLCMSQRQRVLSSEEKPQVVLRCTQTEIKTERAIDIDCTDGWMDGKKDNMYTSRKRNLEQKPLSICCLLSSNPPANNNKNNVPSCMI